MRPCDTCDGAEFLDEGKPCPQCAYDADYLSGVDDRHMLARERDERLAEQGPNPYTNSPYDREW